MLKRIYYHFIVTGYYHCLLADCELFNVEK